MPKHLSVLWVIVVFLAAGCVRQDEQVTAVPPSPSATPIIIETAVPSPTVTILPTNTPQPTLTPTPTAETGYILQPTPTVFPVTTPVSPSEHYQLQTWDETKAMNLIQLSGNYAENVQPIIDTVAEWKEIYTYAQSIVEMTIHEALLRFPETSTRENLEWQIAYAKAMQGKPETTTLIVDLLEAGFANGRYTLDNLNDILKPHRFAIREKAYNPYPQNAINLFGQDEITDLRLITTMRYADRPQSDGVLLAFSRDKPPKIMSADSIWSRGFGSVSQFWLQDITDDEQPEIILDWDISSGGLPRHYLNILHWQKDNFVSLNENHTLPGPHSSLELNLQDENQPEIVTTELFPGGTFTQTFYWDGSTFVLSPNKSSLPESPNPTANRYYGAFYEAKILIELKESIIESWSKEWSEEFGVSFPDVLRFQQAMLYLSLNEEKKAISILEDIVEFPINSEASTISDITKTFLNVYHNPEDAFPACTQALQTLDDIIKLYTIEGTIEYQALNSAAGFNVYQDRLVSICSPIQSLEKTLSAWNTKGMFHNKSIPAFLAQNNIFPKYMIPVDLDGNGIEDWLVSVEMINPGRPPIHYLLAFISTSEEIVMLPITTVSNDELTNLTFETITLPGYEYPVHLLTSSDKPTIFAIETENNVPKQKSWFIYEGWYWFTDYDLHQTNDGNIELIISYESRPHLNAFTEATYRWNSETQDFELIEKRADNSLGIPLDEAITQAETLLLQDGDFEAAIPVLTAVLTELNATEELTWTIPHPLYLLGLAYELSGDEPKAVDTYWSIWQTYPESPYALLAQAKLELKP